MHTSVLLLNWILLKHNDSDRGPQKCSWQKAGVVQTVSLCNTSFSPLQVLLIIDKSHVSDIWFSPCSKIKNLVGPSLNCCCLWASGNSQDLGEAPMWIIENKGSRSYEWQWKKWKAREDAMGCVWSLVQYTLYSIQYDCRWTQAALELVLLEHKLSMAVTCFALGMVSKGL